jgi:nucleotide-binding universal stress UspA family protein
MKLTKKILTPTDLSELSCAGVRYALEEASATGAEVIVYHVVGTIEVSPYYGSEDSYVKKSVLIEGEALERRRRQLADFLRENFADLIPSVTIKQEVEIGTPYQKIVDKAASENVDMIVLSTHGRTGLLRAFLGSVTEKVVRLANCPVLTIRPSLEDRRIEAA